MNAKAQASVRIAYVLSVVAFILFFGQNCLSLLTLMMDVSYPYWWFLLSTPRTEFYAVAAVALVYVVLRSPSDAHRQARELLAFNYALLIPLFCVAGLMSLNMSVAGLEAPYYSTAGRAIMASSYALAALLCACATLGFLFSWRSIKVFLPICVLFLLFSQLYSPDISEAWITGIREDFETNPDKYPDEFDPDWFSQSLTPIQKIRISWLYSLSAGLIYGSSLIYVFGAGKTDMMTVAKTTPDDEANSE